MPAAREALATLNLRLPRHMLERVEALRSAVAEAPELVVLPNITRSDVLRLCVLKGLEVLEERYEEAVDGELAREAERRLDAPEASDRVALDQVLARHGV